MNKLKIQTVEIPVDDLIPANYNPRKHDAETANQLKQSIAKHGFIDLLIVNSALNRKNVIIGGHFKWEVAKDLGYKTLPVVYVEISDVKLERELELPS